MYLPTYRVTSFNAPTIALIAFLRQHLFIPKVVDDCFNPFLFAIPVIPGFVAWIVIAVTMQIIQKRIKNSDNDNYQKILGKRGGSWVEKQYFSPLDIGIGWRLHKTILDKSNISVIGRRERTRYLICFWVVIFSLTTFFAGIVAFVACSAPYLTVGVNGVN